MVQDRYRLYEDTEDAMFHHWDFDAMFDSEADEADTKDRGITDLIDTFIATGYRG